ncbi:MAG TPA: 50S ribosomal protein L6 [bacterium]
MSRIGRLPIQVPDKVTIALRDGRVEVEGPKGTLAWTLPRGIRMAQEGRQVSLTRDGEDKQTRAFHGLARALVNNMVQGVTSGFSRELEVIGVGYRVQVQGKQLTMNLGYSHPVVLRIPEGLTVEAPKPTAMIVKGIDKQLVGEFAASLRRIAPPEPYKGKGIRYAGEAVRRKAGKAATGAAKG